MNHAGMNHMIEEDLAVLNLILEVNVRRVQLCIRRQLRQRQIMCRDDADRTRLHQTTQHRFGAIVRRIGPLT